MAQRKYRRIPRLRPEELKRFWSKVDIQEPDQCWPWMRGRTRGYGRRGFERNGRWRNYKANRVAWAISAGEDPGQLGICHTCDYPACCNPAHLFRGTQKQNMHDCIRKGRFCKQPGVLNPNAKLTEKQVKAIKSELAKTNRRSQTEIAKTFGVRQTLISRIYRGQNWSHIRS